MIIIQCFVRRVTSKVIREGGHSKRGKVKKNHPRFENFGWQLHMN